MSQNLNVTKSRISGSGNQILIIDKGEMHEECFHEVWKIKNYALAQHLQNIVGLGIQVSQVDINPTTPVKYMCWK